MKRRTALKTMLAMPFVAGLAMDDAEASPLQHHDRTEGLLETDILVVGGGTAGVVAAIQAARAGCRTVLVENGSQLGGTITTGGVAFPGLFHAWGKQIVKGIGWELVADTVHMGDGVFPDFSKPFGKDHPRHQIRLNPYLYALVAEEKCLQSGVDIRYYETPVAAEYRNGRWRVEVSGKGLHRTIVCKQMIDCTGNAALAALAGCQLLRDEEVQPGSFVFQFSGYKLEELDRKLISRRFAEALAKGELDRKDAYCGIWNILSRKYPGTGMHVPGADSSTSELHTAANVEGRKVILKLLRFIRTLPGCEHAYIKVLQPEVAVRETYRIDGLYRITGNDYESGHCFEDAVAYSYYPIDLHDQNGVHPKHLREGLVATIPFRALIPKNCPHLIVAGRCVSSDRMANSALRVQASCMAMGQAAACAAVLACKMDCELTQVPLDDLKTLIEKYDGVVPGGALL